MVAAGDTGRRAGGNGGTGPRVTLLSPPPHHDDSASPITDSPPAVLQVPTNTSSDQQGMMMNDYHDGAQTPPPPTTSSSDAYALVCTGPTLALPPGNSGEVTSSGASSSLSSHHGQLSTQSAVQSIYESYSLRYPNPAVLAERLSEAERLADEDRRKREASGSSHSGSSGGGFFSRLFGGGRAKKTSADDTSNATTADQGEGDMMGQQQDNVDADETSGSIDGADLQKEEQEAELGRYNLCGTDAFAVGGIIPQEAHRAARFQLASSSLGADLAPAAAEGCTIRTCRMGNVASYGVVSAVVGWGQIAEFHRVPKPLEQVEEGVGGSDEDGYEQQPSFSFTSDADLLLPSILAYERYQSPSGNNATDSQPDLRRVRAAALGPNCLAISWGCRDGIVVLYRRSRSEKTGMRWDAVGCIEPNMAVVDAAASSSTVPPDVHVVGADRGGGGGKKRKDADQEQPSRTPSPFALDSMRVTDLVPMVLEDDEESVLLGEESDNNATVLLAISRLGGYIELVPIPTDLCRGPIIKSQKLPKRRVGGIGTGGSRPEHYSASLPVLRVSSAAAISTSAYHRDITTLDVHRTFVSATTEWDCDARPDAPPVEFLLAASGSSIEGEGECISLWGVASVYSAPEASSPRKDGADAQQHQQQQQAEMEFSIHVGLVGIIDRINVGSPVSVFASDVTAKNWYHRPERNVRRRISRGDDVGRSVVPSAVEGRKQEIFSISTSVPLRALKFAPCSSSQSPLFLCGLDYHGGLTLLDCTAAHQVAIHQAPPPIRPAGKSPGNEPGPAVGIVAIDMLRSRETMMDWTDNSHGAIIQAGWWWPDSDEATEEYTSHHQSQPLLMTFSSGGELNAYALDMFTDESTNAETCRVVFQGDLVVKDDALDERIFISKSVSFSASPLDSGPFGFIVLSSTTDISSPLHPTVKRQLAPCAVQTLDPAKLIYSLMDQGQNREAIEMTRRLAGFSLSPEVMDICYKALWTDEFDADALLQVSDAHYVIQAARSLGDQFAKAKSEGRRISVTLDQVLKIYRYAIEMATPHSNAFYDKAIQHLRSHVVKAGTYVLLSQQFGDDARKLKAGRFFSTFLRSGAILDIALSCAKRGDVRCLALLFVRHYNEIGSNQTRAQILAQLPLGLSVREYLHLLPIHANKCGGIYSTDDSEKGSSTYLQAWQFASYLQNDNGGMALYLDDQDKLITVDQMRLYSTDCNDDSSGPDSDGYKEVPPFDLAQWFGERAQQIHTLSGLLEPAVDLCSAGLKRLDENDPGKQRLSSFCATAYHLNQIINDDSLLLKDEASCLSISSFAGLGFQGVVRLVLDAGTAVDTREDGDIAKTIVGRYWTILEPMILSEDVSLRMDHWLSSDCGDLESSQTDAMQTRIQHEIMSYCIARLHDEASYDTKMLGRSLEICRAFANASKTAIHRNERIIRDENDLVTFVIRIAYSPHITVTRTILDTLWGLYECLPVRVKSRETADDQWAKLSSTIDTFYRHLLVFEIGLRWCLNPQILGTLHDLRRSKDVGGASIEFGCNILTAMSDAFCKRIKSLRSNEQEEDEAILDFLSDLQEFNEMCFDSALPIGAELENHLVRTLLYQHCFRALRIVVSTKSDWFDEDVVQGAVSEFVLEIMAPADDSIGSFSSSDHGTGPARGDLLRAAIDCQEVFGPIFPKLRQEFDASRRYLDVAHFVHDVLGCKLEPVSDSLADGEIRQGPIASLSAFQATPPIEIIDAVLRENPNAILLGGPDWGDPTFSSQANFDVACYFEKIDAPLGPSDSSGPPDASSLPPPPGGYIIQLSSILALGENSMVVRTKMAYHGAAAGFFGAASAISFLLLRDISMMEKGDEPLDDSEVESSLLGAVGILVSSDSYSDIRMKRELCILSMRYLGSNISKSGFGRDSFDIILRSFPALEAQFSPLNVVQNGVESVSASQSFDTNEGRQMGDSLPGSAMSPPPPPPPPPQQQQQQQASQFLVFKAAGIISRQAKKVVNEVTKSGEMIHHSSTLGGESTSTLSAVLAPTASDTTNAYGRILSSTSTNVHELMTRIQSSTNGTENLDSASGKAILRDLARSILVWCAIEAGKARPNGEVNASTTNQVAKMLQIGSALLLELSDEDRVAILDDTRRTLISEASASVSTNTDDSSSLSVKPNHALVRQLCGRGYSINGARRAAVMTNNADFNTALTWCVAHFQDGDFNEPLIFLKSNEASSSDRHLMGMVEKAICESRRGPVPDIHGPSTEAQPQQSGATASFKKPPLSSTDNNESGFSFDWDDDDDLGEMLEDVDHKAPVAADSAGSVSSKKALPIGDGIAKASAPQQQKAAEKLGADGWDGFDDFDDMLNDDDKGSGPGITPGETNEAVHSGIFPKSSIASNMSVPAKPDAAKPNDSPITSNLPLDSSPTAASNCGAGDGGDGGGWDEDDDFDNFDDMLDEKYGEEDAATQQDTTEEPVSNATPAAIEPASDQLLKSVPLNAEPEVEEEKSVAMPMPALKETVAPRPSQSPPVSESMTVDPVARPSQPLLSQTSASRSNSAPSPTGPKPTNSKLVPTPPPKPTTTKSNGISGSISRPPPPTPPPRPPPAQPKVAAIPTQSPIRSVREKSQLLSQEERKRMAEEGRRLLREKRLAQQSKASSPTVLRSSKSSVSRPTTRSMASSRATDAGAMGSSSAASASTSSKPTAVTDRAGTASKVTDPSERERLIIEGRRLLMEARKAKKNGEAASVGATPKPKLKSRPPPTPPPRRSPPSPSASSAPPPPTRSTPSASNAVNNAGKTEKARDDDDDNWDDFDKF